MVRVWNWWRYVRDADDFAAEKADWRQEQAGRPPDPRDALSLPRGAGGELLGPDERADDRWVAAHHGDDPEPSPDPEPDEPDCG